MCIYGLDVRYKERTVAQTFSVYIKFKETLDLDLTNDKKPEERLRLSGVALVRLHINIHPNHLIYLFKRTLSPIWAFQESPGVFIHSFIYSLLYLEHEWASFLLFRWINISLYWTLYWFFLAEKLNVFFPDCFCPVWVDLVIFVLFCFVQLHLSKPAIRSS